MTRIQARQKKKDLKDRLFYRICGSGIEIPVQFLLKTKRFASVEDSLQFLAPYDLPETSLKNFEKIRNTFSFNF